MRIEIIPCLKDNYSYLVIDESNNTACVIDPSESEPVIDFIEKENVSTGYRLIWKYCCPLGMRCGII